MRPGFSVVDVNDEKVNQGACEIPGPEISRHFSSAKEARLIAREMGAYGRSYR